MNLALKPLLLILLAALNPALAQQNQEADFDSLLAAAQQAQAGNDFATAAEDYKQAVKLRSDIPELWANLGLMQHQAKDYAGAIHSFERALQLKPSLYVPNLFLGVDHLRLGDSTDAIPYLLKAETMNATDPLPRTTLGRAYSSEGNYALAARAYERATHLEPAQGSAWFALGISRLNQVEQDGRRLSEHDQNSPYAKALLAESLVKQTRYNEAMGIYQTVATEQLQPPYIHAELGWIYLRQHDSTAAEAAFAAQNQADPGCSLALLGQARLRIDAGLSADALKLLTELGHRDRGFLQANSSALLEGMDPAKASALQQKLDQQNGAGALSPEIYQLLSSIFNRQPQAAQPSLPPQALSGHTSRQDYAAGRYAQCVASARSSLKTKDAVNLELLAACSFFTGAYDLASDAAQQLATIAPGSAVATYWSIRANEQLAFTALERFQELEPNSARTHLLLGDIYRQRTRYDDAQAEYKKALEITPNEPAALLGLASAYFGDANMQMAIQTAQLGLNQTPDDPDLNLLMAEALITRHQFAVAEPFLDQALHAKPQMLPHVHALLAQVYADQGKTDQAIAEFKLGLSTDEDGSLHYQLARLYRKTGDTRAAAEAIEEMKAIQLQHRQRAAIAIQDPHLSSLDEP